MKNIVNLSIILLFAISACQDNEFSEQAINELANTFENLPSNTCTSLTARYSPHAMWMGRYKDGKSAHFIFNDENGSIDYYADSSAHIKGTVILPDRPDDKWSIDVWITDPKSWEEWSSLGRTYKGEHEENPTGPGRTVGTLFKEWIYYTFDDTKPNRLIGGGINTGDTLELRLYPWDLNFGLQVGYGANDKNHAFGLSAWFTYYLNDKLYEGDFNFDLACPGISPHIPTNVKVTTIAGGSFNYSDPDGTGDEATVGHVNGLCIDAAGNIFATARSASGTNGVLKITPGGVVTTFAGGNYRPGYSDGVGAEANFTGPQDIVINDEGTFYVLDGHSIRSVTPDAAVTTFVENYVGNDDFPRSAAMAIDAESNLYIADPANHKIRKVTPEGTVTTIAGSTQGFANGPVEEALFSIPTGIALDEEGNLYVTEVLNHRIRKISSDGMVSTYAGSVEGYEDGFRLDAKFRYPEALAMDADGNLYVADRRNARIRKILPDGEVTTIAGTESGFYDLWNIYSPVDPNNSPPMTFTDGPGTIARLYAGDELTINAQGTLYIMDWLYIRQITQ